VKFRRGKEGKREKVVVIFRTIDEEDGGIDATGVPGVVLEKMICIEVKKT
jgi:hypothetical protein